MAVLPHQVGGIGAAGNCAELWAFIEKQHALLLDQQKEAKREQKEARQEMEVKLAQAKADMDQLRAEMTPRKQEAITDDELATLQARLAALHAAELLTDDELHAVEDWCADYVELQAAVPEGGVLTKDAVYSAVGRSCAPAVKLHKLVLLSAKMASDAALARQLRRKFL